MDKKGITYRLITVVLIGIAVMAGLLYLDRTTAEASQNNNPLLQPLVVGEVAYVPMGTINGLALIDVQTHTTTGSIDTEQFGCVNPQRARLNPEGTELYITCQNSQNIIVLDTADLTLIATITQPTAYYDDVAFVQSGSFALITGISQQINVVDTTTHTLIQTIPTPNFRANRIAVHPFLPLAYAAGLLNGEWPGAIKVIDTNNFTVIAEIVYGGTLYDAVVSPDGHWVYAGDDYWDGVAKIDVSTNTVVDSASGYNMDGLSISPDGTKIYASRPDYGVVDVIDTANMELITSVDVGGTFENALTCDGSELYVARETASIPVIDTQDYSIPYDISIPGTSSGFGIAICPQNLVKAVYLDPPSQTKYIKAGETITYTLQIANYTDATDSFTLQVLPGNEWTTTLSAAQVGPLDPGGSASFTVRVDVSPDGQPTETDTAIIQATSFTSPSLTATASLNTTVISNKLAYVSMSDIDSLAVIDTLLHTTIGTVDTAQYGCYSPQRVRISPDGSELWVMCNDSHNILILNTSDRTKIATLENLHDYNQDVTFVKLGGYALASGINYSNLSPIYVIDTASHTIVTSIPTTDYTLFNIAVHPFLPLAYAGTPNHIIVIDLNTFTIKTYIQTGAVVFFVRPSPDGRWVFASQQYGGLVKIDVNTNTIVDMLSGYGEGSIEISPDSATIYTGDGWHSVEIIDAINMEPITTIDLGAYTNSSALTCDGSELYVARETASVPIIDTQNYNITYEIPIPGESSGYGVTVCPQYLAKGAFFNPMVEAKDGGHGDLVTYQQTIINNSDIAETFELESMGNQWITQLSSSQIGPIPSGESSSLIITVTVPVDAAWYATDNAIILATGITSPSLTAEAEITTTAFAPAHIGVTPTSLESTQAYGSVTTQTLTISNGDAVTLTYDIYEAMFPGNVLTLHLDEPQGSTTFYDTSGYGNNATCTGDTCPAAGLAGAFGTAVNFDGVDDYLQIQHNPQFDLIEDIDKVSIASWVKVYQWYGGNYFPILIQKAYPSGGGWSFSMGPDRLSFFSWIDNYLYTDCDFNFNLNEWYHLAMSYDRSLGSFQFYINGNQICNNSFDGDIVDTSDWPMNIGFNGSDVSSNGLIDELFIYDRALSQEEIIAIYQDELGGDVPWLSVDPPSGEVPTNGSAPVQVTFDTMGMEPGTFDTILVIGNNDPSQQPSIVIPVSLTVTTPIPPAQATITGPEVGMAGENLVFSALVEPISTTLPLTYVWEAAGQLPITHTGGLTDTVRFTWDTPGTQTITVTVSNQANSVSGTYQVTIAPPYRIIYMPLAQKAPTGGLDKDNLIDGYLMNTVHTPRKK